MEHKHGVYDTDAHFSINPITKAIKNESSKKITLVQFDKKSEVFSFDIPRMVEGHDMTLCDQVKIHFDNIDSATKEVNNGVYKVEDLQVSKENSDMVVFSWEIDDTATQYVGKLEFSITFECTENGEVVYRFGTLENKDISVSKTKNNNEAVAELYPDVLTQMGAQISELEDSVDELEQAMENGGTTTEPKAVSIDFSNFDNGSFSVAYEDGTASVFTVTFDDAGNPVNINDGTNEFAIVWGDE